MAKDHISGKGGSNEGSTRGNLLVAKDASGRQMEYAGGPRPLCELEQACELASSASTATAVRRDNRRVLLAPTPRPGGVAPRAGPAWFERFRKRSALLRSFLPFRNPSPAHTLLAGRSSCPTGTTACLNDSLVPGAFPEWRFAQFPAHGWEFPCAQRISPVELPEALATADNRIIR